MIRNRFNFYTFNVSQLGERRSDRVTVIAESEDIARLAAGQDSETRTELVKQTEFESRLNMLLTKRSLSSTEKLLFYHNISSMMTVGASAAQAFELAAPQMMTPYGRGIVAGMAHRMSRDGDNISSALGHYNSDFTNLDIAILEAGENSGHVVDSLINLAQEYKDAGELKSKVRKAMTYPIVMLFIIAIAFFVITAFVLPNLLAGVLGLGGEVPLVTKILMVLSGILSEYWYIVIGGGLILGAIAFSYWPVVSRMAWFQSTTLRIPVVGKLCRAIVLSRTFSTISVMAKSGIRYRHAFEMARRVAGNHEYEKFFKEVARRHELGDSLHKAFKAERKRIGRDGNIIAAQLKVAEFSGKPDEVIGSIAVERKKMLSDNADVLPTALNPIMTAIITSLGVTIVVAVFAPLISVFANMFN